MRRIITSHTRLSPHPAIDWAAWFDDEGAEAGRYGYGATEAEAIRDLRDTYDEGGLDHFAGTLQDVISGCVVVLMVAVALVVTA